MKETNEHESNEISNSEKRTSGSHQPTREEEYYIIIVGSYTQLGPPVDISEEERNELYEKARKFNEQAGSEIVKIVHPSNMTKIS